MERPRHLTSPRGQPRHGGLRPHGDTGQVGGWWAANERDLEIKQISHTEDTEPLDVYG